MDSFKVKVPVEKRLKVSQCRLGASMYLINKSGKIIFVGDSIDAIIWFPSDTLLARKYTKEQITTINVKNLPSIFGGDGSLASLQ